MPTPTLATQCRSMRLHPTAAFTAATVLLAVLVACASVRTPAHDPDEVVGAWSAPVDAMRARLVGKTLENARGETQYLVYVEFDNVNFAGGRSLMFGKDEFAWEVRDQTGRSVERWNGPVPWIYDYADITRPITLPGGSRLRVPATGAGYARLPEGVLVWCQYPSPWPLEPGHRYVIGATFTAPPHHGPDDGTAWSGTLVLPPIPLPTRVTPRVYPSEPGGAAAHKSVAQ